MKKILIITYYWPPSGDVGGHRPLKFAKYLPQNGWQPIVYTVDNDYAIVDNSLKKDIPKEAIILKQPIWEPYQLYSRFLGLKKKEKVQGSFLDEQKKNTSLQTLAKWIRGNLFIPDARRFWIRPSIKFLTKYLNNNPVDAILSTGPPHTVHLIARQLKRQFQIPWIADFRDPWTKVEYYGDLHLTPIADTIHKRLERSILQEADKVLTVSYHWAKDFEELGAKPPIAVLTNGYDTDDFDFPPPPLTQQFSISHIGLLNHNRNPQQLWKALAELCQQSEDFQKDLLIHLVGKIDYRVLQSLEKHQLHNNLKKENYIPHKEVAHLYSSSQVLLLLVNNEKSALGRIPAKLFEYLAAKRPILCVGPLEGDSAQIVQTTEAGQAFDFQDFEGIKTAIWQYYSAYKAGNLQVKQSQIADYSRKVLTRKLVNLLDEIK